MERILSCVNEIIVEKQMNFDCINFTISTIFSYIILFLSFTLKIPQILSIIKNKSTVGISLDSSYLDFLNVYFLFIYAFKKNLSFWVWGEYISIGLQNLLIVILYWYYEKEEDEIKRRSNVVTRALGASSCLLNVLLGLQTNIYPESIFIVFALANIPSVFLSRFFQIKHLIVNKNPGSLSASSFTMRYLKNYMQAFYLLIQVKDYLLIVNQIFNGTSSLTVFLLIKYYSSQLKKEKETKKD